MLPNKFLEGSYKRYNLTMIDLYHIYNNSNALTFNLSHQNIETINTTIIVSITKCPLREEDKTANKTG